jgi:hypothetical protein
MIEADSVLSTPRTISSSVEQIPAKTIERPANRKSAFAGVKKSGLELVSIRKIRRVKFRPEHSAPR